MRYSGDKQAAGSRFGVVCGVLDIQGLEDQFGKSDVAVLVGMEGVAAPEDGSFFVLLPVSGVIY